MTDQSPDRRFYVYALLRPDGTPFYIGKGQRKRWLIHENLARTGDCSRKSNIIRKIWRAGAVVGRVKILDNLTELEALNVEDVLIRLVGRAPSGPLVNLLNGDLRRTDPSPETRAKMSVAAKRYAATHGPVHAKPHSAETRIILAEKSRGNTSHLGHKHSDEARAKMRTAWDRRRMIAPNRHGVDGRFQPQA